MRRTIIAIAACMAILSITAAGAFAVPGPKAPKAPKTANGTVTLVAPSPAAGTQATTASGNVKAKASCRKNRTVHLKLTDATGVPAGSEVIATTRPNGDYTAAVTAPATPGAYSLTATVDQSNRKSGKGKRARKHVCAALTSAPVTVTVAPAPVAVV